MKVRFWLPLTMATIVGAMALSSGVVNAENTDEMSSGLITVSPSVTKLGDLEPGKTYDSTLSIRNDSDETKTFRLALNTFWAQNDKYDLQWGLSESQYGKIVDWTNIDTEQTYQVAPHETYQLDYTITVPEDQAGGAQRLMISVELNRPKDDSSNFVETITYINALAYATVDGEINPQAKIVNQDIQTFSFDNKIKTSSTLENTGNVDLDVKYHLQITNPFTGEINYEVNDTKTLMAETTRIYEQVWQNAPFIGVFNVKQEIELMGETKVLEKITFICPLWLVIIVAIIIALIIISVIIKHKERKKNRRIEEKMERAGFNG